MELIDKAAVVAEIGRIFKEIGTPPHEDSNGEDWPFLAGEQQMCKIILSFIDTLEVKEIDLEKEITKFLDNGMALQLDWKQCDITVKPDGFRKIAKHFFELGLKAQKGEEV